jgi:thymidylate synthase
MNTISGNSAPEVYTEALWKVPLWVLPENSRNGPVLTCPEPVCLELTNPLHRVLFDPVRKANPYFHVMEFIWMMAGDNSTNWISQFNKGFRNYAELDGMHHGAYGHRWREHFGHDQILRAVDELKLNPESRRVTIGMWDPSCDQGRNVKDVPCNTHLYLRIFDGRLNMTVCNRSNDLFWGMLGSNIVHMTLLQELIANALGIPVGVYRVITNNLHVYTEMPRFAELYGSRNSPDLYKELCLSPYRLLAPHEDIADFLSECYNFIHSPKTRYQSSWLTDVAQPMYFDYMDRLGKLNSDMDWLPYIAADDWRKACELWSEWHYNPAKNIEERTA